MLEHARCWSTVIKPGVASDAPTKEWFSLGMGITSGKPQSMLSSFNKNLIFSSPARIIIQLVLSGSVILAYPILAAVVISAFHEALLHGSSPSLSVWLLSFGALIGTPAIFLSIFARSPARWLRNLLTIGLIGSLCGQVFLCLSIADSPFGMMRGIDIIASAWISGGPSLVAIWNLWRLWKKTPASPVPAKDIL
ncbi:MAG: hypothetical protein LBI02_07280 [Opitutaceae bacterium]|nr:hypothetical protein [Opitutaceae bacterium]